MSQQKTNQYMGFLDIEKLKKKIPNTYTNLEVFSRGKRGVIFKATLASENDSEKKQVVAIKVSHPNSQVKNALFFEAQNLKKVNMFGIGPRLIDYGENFVVMDFILGELIGKWIQKTTSKKDIEKVTQEILIQLATLDSAGLNKFELTNPYKHIIVKKNLDVVLIDFERMRNTIKTKNVNQFKEYIKSTIQKRIDELNL